MHWFWRATIAAFVGFICGLGGMLVGQIVLKTYLQQVSATGAEILRWLVLVLLILGTACGAALTYAYLTRRYQERSTETRCRKCGYILRGIPKPRCPECGEKI